MLGKGRKDRKLESSSLMVQSLVSHVKKFRLYIKRKGVSLKDFKAKA